MLRYIPDDRAWQQIAFAPAGLVRACGLGSRLRAWFAPAGLVAAGSERPPDVHSLPAEAPPATQHNPLPGRLRQAIPKLSVKNLNMGLFSELCVNHCTALAFHGPTFCEKPYIMPNILITDYFPVEFFSA